MKLNLNDEKTTEALSHKPKQLWIVFILCFFISVTSSAGITFFLIQRSQNNDLTSKDDEQDARLTDFQVLIEKQNDQLQEMKDKNETLHLYLRHSSATALKNILINQENNIQAYLNIMKAAMNDLSGYIPKTTDWNIEYQYQLDLAHKSSLKREDLLKLLKTGEPNENTTSEQ